MAIDPEVLAELERDLERVRQSELPRQRVVPIRQGLPVMGSTPSPLDAEPVTDDLESWWLPDPVRLWVDAVAAAYCVPKVMPIAAALCAASLLVQGKARVRIHDAWEEELSLYWLVFAPTGMAKSAVMKAAMAPVRAIQRAAEEELRPVIVERTNERARLEAQIQRMRRATKAHSYSEGAQEHMQQLRELEHQLVECEVPKVPEWLYTDCNPTVIPRLMAHNLEAEGVARVAVCDAEGTFLANLLGRHSGHLNVDPLLAAYTGDAIEMVRTVHGSKDLHKSRMLSSHMVMCIMVQPHYLDKLKAHPELGDNGWLGRCISSRVARGHDATPFMRPEVPEEVRQGYSDWLCQLNAVEAGMVYTMPYELLSDLERMHDNISADTFTGRGAIGWATRSLGRICRIFALISLTGRLADWQSPVGGQPVAAHEGIGKIINYLYNTLYSRALSQAQAVEPARHPLPTLCRRTLGWLCRSARSAGSTVTLREIRRALTISREDAMAACDMLCESGHLALAEEKKRHNQTLSLTYTVLSTDPDAGSPPVVDS